MELIECSCLAKPVSVYTSTSVLNMCLEIRILFSCQRALRYANVIECKCFGEQSLGASGSRGEIQQKSFYDYMMRDKDELCTRVV